MTHLPGIRIDKWLWQARFFKSRSLAAAMIEARGVRINGTRSAKPAALVRPGDLLTFVQAETVRVVRVRDTGTRRGPAVEAQLLYEALSDSAEAVGEAVGDTPPRSAGSGDAAPAGP